MYLIYMTNVVIFSFPTSFIVLLKKKTSSVISTSRTKLMNPNKDIFALVTEISIIK